jgi:hypothetical protein
MLNISKLSPNTLEAIAYNRNHEGNHEPIARLSFEEALDAWLEYNGIINYTRSILRVIEELKGAEQP